MKSLREKIYDPLILNPKCLEGIWDGAPDDITAKIGCSKCLFPAGLKLVDVEPYLRPEPTVSDFFHYISQGIEE
jgi:hypothetical protein